MSAHLTGLFPDVAPGRAESQLALANALSNTGCRIYLDASVLTLSYDISSGAREEMLAAFEQFDGRIHIPLWAAHETWNNGRSRKPGQPLQPVQQVLDKAMRQYLKTALSQLDEQFAGKSAPVKKSDFERDYRALAQGMVQLTNNVGGERKPEIASEKLTPFINRFVLSSNLAVIIDRVRREGVFRHAHGIPPGHADIRKGKADDTNSPSRETNQFGDLIIWFELLEHARASEATEILFLTNDVAKDDWVYRPRKVKDNQGRAVLNTTMTLPLPLLITEAALNCPKLERLHIISIDELVRVLATKFSQALPQLSVALQPETEEFVVRPPKAKEAVEPKPDVATQVPPPTSTADGALPELTFTVSDLNYEPAEGNPLDGLIYQLSALDWQGQNKAARGIEAHDLTTATKSQRIHLGVSLTRAANALAVDPLKLLEKLLLETIQPLVSREVLLGVLAEVYLSPEGDLKRPAAAPSLTELVFDCARLPTMSPAVSAIMTRLDSQRKYYLALPDEPERVIKLEATVNRSESPASLVSLKANGVELLVKAGRPSQRFPTAGSGIAVTGEAVVETVSSQFVVPTRYLELAGHSAKLSIPDHVGFIAWGPGSGLPMRQVT